MQNKDNPFLHTPAKSTSNYVKWAEELQDAPKIDYGCVLDEHIIPLHPGDFKAVVARPGHGKSSYMAYMAKRAGLKIRERGDTNKCAIYVSWEQSVEEIEAFFQSGDSYSSTDLAWGRIGLDKVKRNAVKRVNLPVWMMGYSISEQKSNPPPMTIDLVLDAIRQMKYEYNYQPVLICFDYLQIIPVRRGMKRTEEVSEAVNNTKLMAMELGVPIIGGVQASRASDERGDKMPTMADAQHTSMIEQRADKQIALMRPIRYLDEGEEISIAGNDYAVDNDMMVVKLLKQRFDIGYGSWPVKFKPDTLEMSDYLPRQNVSLE